MFDCPHCGEPVRVGARGCRECGSDIETGWQNEEEIDYQSLDLPQGYSRDAEHPGAAAGSRGSSIGYVVVTLVLVAALALWAILRTEVVGMACTTPLPSRR